jgi:hypothetical protein
MRTIFKLALMYLFVWIGVRSILKISTEETMFSFFLDLVLFVLFLGSPAANYWGSVLDNLLGNKDENENNENDK